MTSDVSSAWDIHSVSSPNLTWGAKRHGRRHECPHCHIPLLTGERPGFCCGPNGSRLHDVPPLPPLPPQMENLMQHPQISSLSRILNLIFSFACLETTHPFPDNMTPPAFFAIQGRVYHRIRPTHENSAVRWLLYDGFMQNVPHAQWAATLPDGWIECVRQALSLVNPFVRYLHHFRSFSEEYPSASLILKDVGADEVAALMSYSNTSSSENKDRRLIISRRSGRTQSVPAVSRLWEPLCYPLLFPHGTLGWGLAHACDALANEPASDSEYDQATTQLWHYRTRLLHESRFHTLGRLTNEYAVDMFSRNLETRLNFIRHNQERIRREDAELMNTEELSPSENIYLPASFLGSRRWAATQIADSLAVASALGNPTFFITMTCNAAWPEIVSQLQPGQTFSDIPVVVARVFKRKLHMLLQTLKTMFVNAGRVQYCIYCVEFQKRGLPHAHILLKYSTKCETPCDIDAVVSAEVPPDPCDAQLVRTFMTHNHPSQNRPPSTYCQVEKADGTRSCRFNYPHPLQPTTTIDNDGRVHYRRRHAGDEMIVAHCLPLLRKFKCHLNFEVAGTSHIFQYLFKYIHKGPDHARYTLHSTDSSEEETVDEIEDYWNSRYLSAGEAVWRILGYHITHKDPAVTALPVHLPTSRSRHQYHGTSGPKSTLSLLQRYFIRPTGNFHDSNNSIRNFDDLSYMEYFTLFRLSSQPPANAPHFQERSTISGCPPMYVVLRNTKHHHICRLEAVRPTQGDLFYLRAILQNRAVLSFTDALCVDHHHFASYQEAATALRLFAEHDEAHYTMREAAYSLYTPPQLRYLLIHLLLNDCVPQPLALWENFKHNLSTDFKYLHNNEDDIAQQLTLGNIGEVLEEHGKCLGDFGLPQSTQPSAEVLHERRKWSSNTADHNTSTQHTYDAMTQEQQHIFNVVVQCAVTRTPMLIFVDGKAGRGKTFLVNAICSKLRSLQHIVLPTATAASAALLYPGGRTTHSTFKVPVNENNELLQSTIGLSSSRAQLIRESRLIIWDEAPMANRAVLACVNDVCQKIMKNDMPFGGKPVVLLGDFRQTSPVVRGGSRKQVVDASVRSSPLWNHFSIMRLTKPIRNAEDSVLMQLVDTIGDGAGPDVPMDLFHKVSDSEQLSKFVFPDEVLNEPQACLQRAILCPTNEQIDFYNSEILQRLPNHKRTYFATDSLMEADDAGLLPPQSILDYVSRRTPPGLPPHTLTIYVGGIYRLIRNFSLDRGLAKNCRVVITSLGHRIIAVKTLRNKDDPYAEEEILIPRITFNSTLSSGHTLLRRQFPLAHAYATTFNSCQGLTLDRVGIDLTKPVFSHGQLYTALSRVRHREDARVLLNSNDSTTTNVTFHELLI